MYMELRQLAVLQLLFFLCLTVSLSCVTACVWFCLVDFHVCIVLIVNCVFTLCSLREQFLSGIIPFPYCY